jgi:hypothetical protein
MPLQSVTTAPHYLYMKYDDKQERLDFLRICLKHYFSIHSKPPSKIGMNRNDIIADGKKFKGDYLRGVIYRGHKILVVPVKTCIEFHTQLYE